MQLGTNAQDGNSVEIVLSLRDFGRFLLLDPLSAEVL